jgi:hypothetical protein
LTSCRRNQRGLAVFKSEVDVRECWLATWPSLEMGCLLDCVVLWFLLSVGEVEERTQAKESKYFVRAKQFCRVSHM